MSSVTSGSLITSTLRKFERHVALSEAEKKALENSVSHVATFERRDTIFDQGSRPSHSFIMLSGVTGRFKILSNGRRQILSFQIAGDFADLHSRFLKTMDHGVEALSSVRLACLPHRKIECLMHTYPRLAIAFAWDLAVDAAIQREWMVSLGQRSAYEQVAHLVCELLVRLRAVGLAEDDAFELPINQSDLADALGISTVHLNRSLQALRRRGLIEFKNPNLKIPDIRALRRVADFQAAYLD